MFSSIIYYTDEPEILCFETVNKIGGDNSYLFAVNNQQGQITDKHPAMRT